VRRGMTGRKTSCATQISPCTAPRHSAGRAIKVFDTAMHARAMARLQLETDLRRAIERHEFRLHYQPIVSLATGLIAGF